MNLDELYNRFPKQQDCLRHLEKIRWPDEIVCPACDSHSVSALPREHRHHCNKCNCSFSATVGTPFHHTHSDLQKWFLAVHLMLNARRSISVRRLSRSIQINKNTAWHMMKRIRPAMKQQRKFLEEVICE